MTVYVVSRNYLQYIFDEFIHLDTKMVGYGSLKRAYNGMLEVNACDLGGFIYVGDKITQQKSFALFLQRADMVANKGTVFMIALNDSTGLERILGATKLRNLEVLLYEYDVLTDFSIRRDIIAPVILSKIKPFTVPKPRVVDPRLRETTPFLLPQVFSKRFSDSFLDPSQFDSIGMAIEFDPVLAEREPKTFWYEFRMWFLYACYGLTYKIDWRKYEGEMDDLEYCSVKYVLEGA